MLGPQVIRLRPSPYCRTPIHGYNLLVEPTDHFLNWITDPVGNWMARLVFTQPVAEVGIRVEFEAELAESNPFDFFVEPAAVQWPFAYDAVLRRELAAYMEPPADAERLLQRFAADIPKPIESVALLAELNSRVHSSVAYLSRDDAGVQVPWDTVCRATGACRDTAWLLVALFRLLGFGARFVSGYLIQRVAESSTSELHAWAEAYIPGAGWLGFDPTLGTACTEGHIPLAATVHYSAAAPVSGTYFGTTAAELTHEITVRAGP